MTNWTLILSFFKTLPLEHLERCLYSLSRQTVKPSELLLFDNASGCSTWAIKAVLDKHFKAEQWVVYHARHNGGRTLSWANNSAIRLARNDTFVFTRADYIYDFHFCERMLREQVGNPMHYATAWMWGMSHADLEVFNWRQNPQVLLAHSQGARPERNSHLDGPTFCTTKQAMEAGRWYDEGLVGWGYDQQDLQKEMVRAGVIMKVIPEFLYFHMHHDIDDMQTDDAARAGWLKSPRRQAEIRAEEARLEKAKIWYNRLLRRKP